jgi:bacterial/archaeal transporter family-2 protein
VLRPRLRRSVTLIPAAVRSGGLRAWHLLGGLGGAWLVTTQGLVVTVVGVTIFTIAVVAGQVSGSLFVDRAGLSPAGRMPVTRNRAVAALVALAAVALASMQGGQVGLAINARVAVATHQPLAATLVNFIVGFSALMLICIVLLATGVATFAGWPTQWWLYLGGPIGVTFIALAAWAVRRVGVLVFGLLSIGGQLLGSVAMDLIAPTGQATLGWLQWLGLLLIAGAVALATLPQDRFGRAVVGKGHGTKRA